MNSGVLLQVLSYLQYSKRTAGCEPICSDVGGAKSRGEVSEEKGKRRGTCSRPNQTAKTENNTVVWKAKNRILEKGGK